MPTNIYFLCKIDYITFSLLVTCTKHFFLLFLLEVIQLMWFLLFVKTLRILAPAYTWRNTFFKTYRIHSHEDIFNHWSEKKNASRLMILFFWTGCTPSITHKSRDLMGLPQNRTRREIFRFPTFTGRYILCPHYRFFNLNTLSGHCKGLCPFRKLKKKQGFA